MPTTVTMDPTPYFVMAYGAGIVLILGFTAWTLRERARLRRLIATLAAPKT
jgi:hypothetical protein